MPSKSSIIIISIICIFLIVAFIYTQPAANQGQGPWTWIGNGGGSSTNTPSPWIPWSPSPTQSPGTNPTSNPTTYPVSPTPVPAQASGYVWQSLYVTEQNGHEYWYNAKQPFIVQSILGKESQATDFKQVSKISNEIWMKIDANHPVDYYVFRCDETIYVQHRNQHYILINQAPVEVTGRNFVDNEQVRVTSASVTASDLQTLINNAGVPNNPPGIVPVISTFNIALNHIELELHFTDGQTITLRPTTSDVNNVLTWQIILT